MRFERFEDIAAWKMSRELAREIYAKFNRSRDFGFRDQILRASVSIMNNIAEGFERSGNREFIRFLRISRGSCAEVCSMLYLAKDLAYLSEDEFNGFIQKSKQITRVLSGLLRSLGAFSEHRI